MKKRVKGAPDGAVPPGGDVPQSEDASDSTSSSQSPLKEQGVEAEVTEGKHTHMLILVFWLGEKAKHVCMCVCDFYKCVIFLTCAFYFLGRRGQH